MLRSRADSMPPAESWSGAEWAGCGPTAEGAGRRQRGRECCQRRRGRPKKRNGAGGLPARSRRPRRAAGMPPPARMRGGAPRRDCTARGARRPCGWPPPARQGRRHCGRWQVRDDSGVRGQPCGGRAPVRETRERGAGGVGGAGLFRRREERAGMIRRRAGGATPSPQEGDRRRRRCRRCRRLHRPSPRPALRGRATLPRQTGPARRAQSRRARRP